MELSEDDIASPPYHPDSLNDYGKLIAYAHEDTDVFTLQVATQPVMKGNFNVQKMVVATKEHDFVRLAPNFGFVPATRIQKTIENTTQFARMDTRLPLCRNFKCRFPAANVSRLNEVVATDTFFFDSPALDDGIMGHGGTTMLQLFCGVSSLLTAVFPMKTETDMAGTLEDFIQQHGAPNAFFSDNSNAQIGRAVQEIL
jgi:hypothetical protein